MSVAMLMALPRRRMPDHQEPLHEELEQIRVALHQMASEARDPAPRPKPRNAADRPQCSGHRRDRGQGGNGRAPVYDLGTAGVDVRRDARIRPRRARTGAGKNGDRLNPKSHHRPLVRHFGRVDRMGRSCAAACCAAPALAEELQRRRGTRLAEHLKLMLAIIDRQVH